LRPRFGSRLRLGLDLLGTGSAARAHNTGTQALTNLRAGASVLVSLKVVRRNFTNLLFQEVTQR
jgi:hypothetical protein